MYKKSTENCDIAINNKSMSNTTSPTTTAEQALKHDGDDSVSPDSNAVLKIGIEGQDRASVVEAGVPLSLTDGKCESSTGGSLGNTHGVVEIPAQGASKVIDLTVDTVAPCTSTSETFHPDATATTPSPPCDDSPTNEDTYDDYDEYMDGYPDCSYYDDSTGEYYNHDGTYGGTYL